MKENNIPKLEFFENKILLNEFLILSICHFDLNKVSSITQGYKTEKFLFQAWKTTWNVDY